MVKRFDIYHAGSHFPWSLIKHTLTQKIKLAILIIIVSSAAHNGELSTGNINTIL